MTKELIGRLIGHFILAFGSLILAYFVVAFINWQVNPGAWSGLDRAATFLTAFIIFSSHRVSRMLRYEG